MVYAVTFVEFQSTCRVYSRIERSCITFVLTIVVGIAPEILVFHDISIVIVLEHRVYGRYAINKRESVVCIFRTLTHIIHRAIRVLHFEVGSKPFFRRIVEIRQRGKSPEVRLYIVTFVVQEVCRSVICSLIRTSRYSHTNTRLYTGMKHIVVPAFGSISHLSFVVERPIVVYDIWNIP